MKGSYNAVTQSGSGEISRVDYQESRKSSLLGFGLVMIVLAAIAALIWWVLSKIPQLNIPDPVAAVTNAYKAGTAAVVTGANTSTVTKDPLTAINAQGNPYPVKQLTSQDYESMLNQLGLIKPLVQAGTVITPPFVLQDAATAGAQAAETVNKAGLNNAYVDLDPVSKGLVTFGEGVGKVFGIDLIQLGVDMRAPADRT